MPPAASPATTTPAATGGHPTYLSITSLVCSEITSVTTQLRVDARASVSYLGSSATIPRLQRNFKRAREVALVYMACGGDWGMARTSNGLAPTSADGNETDGCAVVAAGDA